MIQFTKLETLGMCLIALALACSVSKSTLAPVDQAALINAQRDANAIVTRLDASMPAPDRALAKGAFCAVDGVLWRAGAGRVDAGFTCR